MVELQVVKSTGSLDRPLSKRRVCTIACCVDNAYGRCLSQSSSAKICNEPCAKFVQAVNSCVNCCKCACLAS